MRKVIKGNEEKGNSHLKPVLRIMAEGVRKGSGRKKGKRNEKGQKYLQPVLGILAEVARRMVTTKKEKRKK